MCVHVFAPSPAYAAAAAAAAAAAIPPPHGALLNSHRLDLDLIGRIGCLLLRMERL